MPFIIPQLIKIALGAAGTAAIVHWVVKEMRRINAELEGMQTAPAVDSPERQELPTLRRDPATGVYRVI